MLAVKLYLKIYNEAISEVRLILDSKGALDLLIKIKNDLVNYEFNFEGAETEKKIRQINL